VKKHEAAAAAAAAEQPHPSTLESSSTSVDSHIPSGHLISGAGIGQVITSSQSSGMKSLSGMYVCVYQLCILCAVGTLYTHRTHPSAHTLPDWMFPPGTVDPTKKKRNKKVRSRKITLLIALSVHTEET